MDVERTPPASMYNAPPYAVAEQESKVIEERVSLYPDANVAEIAPPFSPLSQEINSLCPVMLRDPAPVNLPEMAEPE